MPGQYTPRTPVRCPNCATPFNFETERLYQAAVRNAERFRLSVDRLTTPDGCWPWTGFLNEKGYGRFSLEPDWQTIAVSRFALEQRLGRPIPKKLMALHTCDNPPCARNDGAEGTYEVNGVVHVRFGHLFLGTNADNMADMVSKGRGTRGRFNERSRIMGDRNGSRLHPECQVRGERHGSAKLTETQVREIRERAANSELQSFLAHEFGVSDSTIWKIVKRQKWQHVL